jgi:hypothetical protein
MVAVSALAILSFVGECRRLEGISDPDDMAIVYAVQTASGIAP